MQRTIHAATLFAGAAFALAFQAEPHAGPAPPSPTGPKARVVPGIQIRLAGTNGESVEAILEESAAARDFRALLPLTLTLTDYNATEKIADLPRRLSMEGAPVSIDPEPGDLAYYAPWGNLAIFYKDFGTSRGLVRLGRLSRIPDAFRRSGPVSVTIEAVP